ncbi:MAG: NAD(P)-binding domain-containing protein [Actinomycetia bacterium]|nr:NAD(P)-binding domain-containing protein [Actinomycetes bacterium]MCH9801682.1 NAD(P)-binding domain-containing protein [Actinomycetes bacterium]
MTTIGFIGSGNIGSTVARLAVAAGYDVIMSNSRGPETLADLVTDLGPQATAGTTAEAAASDLVVVTIPLGRVASVPAAELAGRVVIDTMNYYPGRDGEMPELAGGDMSSSELVQQYLADSQVVKAFNNIFFQHLAELARPAGAADRSALPIAGNDEVAKRLVTEFLDRIGYDVADMGPLTESWRSQPDTPVYGTVYAADPTNWGAGPSPAGVAAVTAAAAAATR